MNKNIKIMSLTPLIFLAMTTQATPNTDYLTSEKTLNEQYSFIQSAVKNTPTEKNNLLNIQRQWITARNAKCNFTNTSSLDSSKMNCLTLENNKRIVFFKSNYFNFDALEQNLIRPITYSKTGQKVLANNDCLCDGQILKIKNNQLYVYSACNEKLTEPQIYNILKKVKNETYVEYSIDTNNNKVADFNLSFVISAQNTWKIVPKVFRQQDLITLNFKVDYTTSPQVKRIQQDCGDFDG